MHTPVLHVLQGGLFIRFKGTHTRLTTHTGPLIIALKLRRAPTKIKLPCFLSQSSL